ncbi:TPA: hypothetical protein ACOB5F_001163 [Neisseria gonorrhoeae]
MKFKQFILATVLGATAFSAWADDSYQHIRAVRILLLILSVWCVGWGIRQRKNRPANTAVTKLGIGRMP